MKRILLAQWLVVVMFAGLHIMVSDVCMYSMCGHCYQCSVHPGKGSSIQIPSIDPAKERTPPLASLKLGPSWAPGKTETKL